MSKLKYALTVVIGMSMSTFAMGADKPLEKPKAKVEGSTVNQPKENAKKSGEPAPAKETAAIAPVTVKAEASMAPGNAGNGKSQLNANGVNRPKQHRFNPKKENNPN